MGMPVTSRRAMLFGAASVLAACQSKPAAERSTKTLTILKAQDSSTFDPAFLSTIHDLGPISLLYERLARHEVIDGVPTGRLIGEVAESWTPNADNTVWTVRLRRDRRFDDGTAVDAAAVVFTRQRNMQANPALARDARLVSNLTAVDPFTLRYELAEPSPVFPHFLAYPQASVINPTVAAKAENGDAGRAWLSQNSAGSGPYRLESWARGQRIVLVASPNAFQKPAFFDRIEYRPIADEGSRRTVFEKGGVDIMEGVSLDSVARLSKDPDVQVLDLGSPRWVGLVYNTQLAPLTDTRIRGAIDAAIDRAGLISGVLRGRAKPMATALPPGVPGYSNVAAPPRDLPRARELLRQAGYGPEKRLKLTLNLFKDDSAIEGTALSLQANLAEIGVDVALRLLTPAANLQATATGQFQLAIIRTSPPIPDGWVVLEPAFRSGDPNARGGNFAGYANPAVDALLDEAKIESDVTQRQQIYRKAADLIQKDLPISFLYATNGFLATGRDLVGLNYSAWFPYHYNAATMSRV